MIILPRQARDKHRENSKKECIQRPPVPSLLGLEQQLTAVWRLSDDDDANTRVAGTLLPTRGSPGAGAGVPVTLSGVGTLLLALGGGPGRWQQQQQQGRRQQALQAVGYQLGFLQPAQNHYGSCPTTALISRRVDWKRRTRKKEMVLKLRENGHFF